MAGHAVAKDAKLTGFALVRDRHGHPQFNDWDNIPEGFHDALSVEDWEFIEQQREEKCP